MTYRPPTSLLTDTAVLLNRATLGLLFLLASIRKFVVTEEGQTVLGKLSNFAEHVASMAPLPLLLGRAYGYALPFVEGIAGFMLILGLASRVAATTIALMLASFLIAFGLQIWPADGGPFNTNVILLSLAILLAVHGPGRFSVDAML